MGDEARKLRDAKTDKERHSSFALERGKLFRAVPHFVAFSTGLTEFVADSIQLPFDVVVQLGKSLLMTSARKTPRCISDVV
jgi:hypothetical protein